MKRLTRLLSLSLLLILGGCDNGEESTLPGLTGYLLPAGVQGIEYETTTYSGLTGVGGSFQYEPGDLITFRVGDIIFGENIPAKQYMTYLDFVPDVAASLELGEVVQGLHYSSALERVLALEASVDNRARFIGSLDEDGNILNGIVVSALNRDLLSNSDLRNSLDFDVPSAEFTEVIDDDIPDSEDSVAVQIIRSLCFPDFDRDCEDENGRLLLTGELSLNYLEDTEYRIGERIFVLPEYYEIAAGDTRIFEAKLSLRGLHGEISEMEVATSDELAQLTDDPPPTQKTVVGIDSFSVDEGIIRFFAVGDPGDTTEIVVNIRLDNDYRWIRKIFRVALL